MIANIEEKAKDRDYSADILRIVLIACIVIHHSLVHGLGLINLKNNILVPETIDSIIYFILNGLCIVGVNGFFWLSGYFSINSSLKKIFILYFECVLYMATFQIGGFLLFNQDISIKLIFLPVLDYWFMGVYFFVSILGPYITFAINKMDEGIRWKLFISLLLLNTVYGFLFDLNGVGNGYTAIQGVIMYVFGRICYENQNSIRKRVGRPILFIDYIILSFIVGGFAYTLYRIGRIGWAWKFYSYNNPLIIMASIALGMLFVGYNISKTRAMRGISSLGRSALVVYLLTDNYKVKKIIFSPLVKIVERNTILIDIISILLYALVLCAVSMMIDKALKYIIRFISTNICRKSVV